MANTKSKKSSIKKVNTKKPSNKKAVSSAKVKKPTKRTTTKSKQTKAIKKTSTVKKPRTKVSKPKTVVKRKTIDELNLPKNSIGTNIKRSLQIHDGKTIKVRLKHFSHQLKTSLISFKDTVITKCKDFFEDIINYFKKIIYENKNLEKKVKIYRIVVVCLIVLLIVVSFGSLGNITFKTKYSKEEKEVLQELPQSADSSMKKIWKENYDKAFVKEDYVGQIIFESGIINEAVVQGDTNDTYLRRNYETYKYEVLGPVFMDYECDVDSSQNLVLYGHNTYTSDDPYRIQRFTPLHNLEDENLYDHNKIIYMAYEDKVDVYLVASVYTVKVAEKSDGGQYLIEGEPKYYLPNYGINEFKEYKEGIKLSELYQTGIEITNSDKLLTLQTCFEDKLDKLVVVAKKISTLKY